VEIQAAPAEIAERLTHSGTEVESLHEVGTGLEGVVAAEVLSVAPHPQADRLQVCEVSVGTARHRVVCGAENFGVGDKVPYAGPGCALAGGQRIKRAKIRGVESHGMLCAEDELGLSADHSGLMLLPRECPAGTPLPEVLGPPETVLEVEVTWNRSDCLCMLGIARELSALFRSPMKLPPAQYPAGPPDVGDRVDVRIEDAADCPRYTARLLTDVTLGPSPVWMQRRLRLCGVRAINNVVDTTNYVMLECGQPLHAFDYRLLRDRRIAVRRARPDERMATLDGLDRPLNADRLVIADGRGPVALAGVMGGAGSEIGSGTSEVLLESACFDAALIHRTSVALGLSTESSLRFERGVDAAGCDWASRRAAALIVAHAGGTAASGVVDVYPGEAPARRVTCRYGRLRGLLGIAVADEEVVSTLTSLGMTVESATNASCTVRIPSFRGDLTIEADLIEEVARVHGLDAVPAATPRARIAPGADDHGVRAVSACRTAAAGLGLSEIVNYSFVSGRLLDRFGTTDREARVVLPNPVSAEHAVLRDSLIPQMVECLGRNAARQIHQACLFEIGTVFRRGQRGAVDEDERMCVGLMGDPQQSRRTREADDLFRSLKGVLEALCATLHTAEPKGRAAAGLKLQLAPADHPGFEKGRCVSVSLGDESLGVMGVLSADLRREWRIGEPVCVGEWRTAVLASRVFRVPTVTPVPVYPSVTRDMALVVQEAVRHEDILKIVWNSAPKELTDVKLFDIFRSREIGKGKKSLAYSLVYRSSERTLTDDDANGYHETIKKALKSGVDAEIREG